MIIRGFSSGLLTLLAVGGLTAGEPTIQVLVPDATRLQRHLEGGVWATVVGGPQVEAWLAAGQDESHWRAGWRGAGQLRIAIERPILHGGIPAGAMTVAATAAAAAPTASLPLRVRRDGAWMVGGLASTEQALPGQPVLSAAAGNEDLALVMRMQAMRGFLAAEVGGGYEAVCKAWSLDGVQILLNLTAGQGESLIAERAVLPLRPVDPVALAGLPAGLAAVAAFGLDGTTFASQAAAMTQMLGRDAVVLSADCEARLGMPLEGVAGLLDGTVVLALAGTPAAPQLLCSMPAGPAVEKALLHWLNSAHPEPDDGVAAAAIATLATALEQPAPISGLGRGSWFIKRTADRLWLATDAQLLAACGVDGEPYPVDERWPGSAGAVLLAHWDAGASARILARALPSQGRWAGLRPVLEATSSPPGHLIVRQDASGLQVAGRDALTWLVPLGAAAVATAPGLAADRIRAIDRAATQRMQRILQRCISFNKSVSGHWPRDIEDLRTWAKDLTADDFAAPGRPDITLAYRYVPPAAGAPADQPVLVQDPAGRDGQGGLVGFADGRVEYRPGMLFWQEAVRLQALPGIRETGVEAGQWATMPKTF